MVLTGSAPEDVAPGLSAPATPVVEGVVLCQMITPAPPPLGACITTTLMTMATEPR